MKSLRIKIEEYDSGLPDTGKQIYLDYKDVPLGMPVKRCANWMLSKALEHFQETPKQKRHD